MQPEEAWQRAIRPLPADNLLEKDMSDKKNIRFYDISLCVSEKQGRYRSEIIAAYPMPHTMGRPMNLFARFATETESNIVWVVSVLIWRGLEVKILLVVIDHELLYHIEANGKFEYN